MKFYNKQHEFYCGIDLHANSMHVCVVEHGGNKLLHKNFDTKKPEKFLAALQPFAKHDLIIGCESTFNWYWLADLCHHENLSFLLGHALYLKAIHGGKTKSDRIDSEKLAMLLRGGNFPTSYVYPKEMRGTRDVVATWSDEEVAQRWLRLFPWRRNEDGSPAEPQPNEIDMIVTKADVLAKRRRRLSDLSWWMRCTTENVVQT